MDENTNTNVEQQEEQKTTYTLEEVNQLLQKEGDRRVSSAMAKKEREIKALQKKLENEKSLSQLDEESRAAAEKDMKIAELQEQLKEYQTAKAKSEVQGVLGKRGLPVELADYIRISEDVEEAVRSIDAIEKIIKDTVANEVKKRMPAMSNIPQVADVIGGKMTKEQFNALPIYKQQELMNSEPDLVNSIINS
jgi:hypothetical protein